VATVGGLQVLLKLTQWRERRGVRVCVRASSQTPKAVSAMWRSLQRVEDDVVRCVVAGWGGLVLGVYVPWHVKTELAEAAGDVGSDSENTELWGGRLALFALDELLSQRNQAGEQAQSVEAREAMGGGRDDDQRWSVPIEKLLGPWRVAVRRRQAEAPGGAEGEESDADEDEAFDLIEDLDAIQ
jgi:hypothetical protein